MYMYTYMYMYICVCVYMCICIYVHVKSTHIISNVRPYVTFWPGGAEDPPEGGSEDLSDGSVGSRTPRRGKRGPFE